MTAVTRSGGRLLIAIAMRLLTAVTATLATVVFSYLLLHQNSLTGRPTTPGGPLSTVSSHP
ncbi:hypothetical protein AB0B25_27135 [Nocardia sp. NPDC049190]|uniref:hypothetical protein n=1 Tax=Nocardia sp. NPDC049190 TaxID=3155650 RepID=UPI0033D105E0